MNRDPDIKGVANAWTIHSTPEMEAAHVKEWGYPPASVGPTYLINGPYHPMWNWWYLATVSLADVPGMPKAHKRYPGAEYEIMCLSLNPNPDAPRMYPPDIERIEAGDLNGLPGFLSPPDWVVQFHGVTIPQAIHITNLAARHICNGFSCDSDFREAWKRIIAKTVEHFTTGHPELN